MRECDHTEQAPEDLVLLNRASYRIRTGLDPGEKVDTYEIVDASTGVSIGFAAENAPGRLQKTIRGAFGRNLLLTQLRIYDAASQQLVFTIHELASLWTACVLVRDADGNRFCTFRGRFALIGGGFVVRDANGRLIGRLEAERAGAPYLFLGSDGRQLGTIEELPMAETAASGAWIERYSVRASGLADCGHAVRVLLLASALSMDIVYRARV